MATIHDVARRAGVSATTAKRAIRAPERLAEGTLARVRRAIAELEYEPHQLASALRGGRSRTVGLLMGDVLEPTFAMLTRTIGRDLQARGYSLLLADNAYDSTRELQNLRMFYGHRISGLIMRTAYPPSNYDYVRQLCRRGVAVVEIDYVQHDTPFSYVMLENERATAEGTEHLVRLGHRRIACVGMGADDTRPEERYTGFLRAARRFGLDDDPVLYQALDPMHLSEDSAYARTQHLLSLPHPPTALFAFNGTCSLGAFRAVRDAGVRVPEEISLLAFDNYSWTSLVDPPLDVLEQPIDLMGREAVSLLMRQIDQGENGESGRPAKVVRRRFSARLIERGSCGPPPA